MITVKTSDIISYIKNHISKEEYDNAHRIDVVITILDSTCIETEFIQDELDSVFCFHDDFWDYLSEYRTGTIGGDNWYRIWWRIR